LKWNYVLTSWLPSTGVCNDYKFKQLKKRSWRIYQRYLKIQEKTWFVYIYVKYIWIDLFRTKYGSYKTNCKDSISAQLLPKCRHRHIYTNNERFIVTFGGRKQRNLLDRGYNAFTKAYEIAFPLKHVRMPKRYVKRLPWMTKGLIKSSISKASLLKKTSETQRTILLLNTKRSIQFTTSIIKSYIFQWTITACRQQRETYLVCTQISNKSTQQSGSPTGSF